MVQVLSSNVSTASRTGQAQDASRMSEINNASERPSMSASEAMQSAWPSFGIIRSDENTRIYSNIAKPYIHQHYDQCSVLRMVERQDEPSGDAEIAKENSYASRVNPLAPRIYRLTAADLNSIGGDPSIIEVSSHFVGQCPFPNK